MFFKGVNLRNSIIDEFEALTRTACQRTYELMTFKMAREQTQGKMSASDLWQHVTQSTAVCAELRKTNARDLCKWFARGMQKSKTSGRNSKWSGTGPTRRRWNSRMRIQLLEVSSFPSRGYASNRWTCTSSWKKENVSDSQLAGLGMMKFKKASLLAIHRTSVAGQVCENIKPARCPFINFSLIQIFWMRFHLKQWGAIQPWSLQSGSPQQNQKDALKRRLSQGLWPNWKSRPTILSLSHRLRRRCRETFWEGCLWQCSRRSSTGSEKTQRRYRLGTWNGRWRKPLEEGRACRHFTFTKQWVGPREMHKKEHNGQLAGQMASLLVFKWHKLFIGCNGQLAGQMASLLVFKWRIVIFFLHCKDWAGWVWAPSLPSAQPAAWLLMFFEQNKKQTNAFFSTRASSARALLQRDASSAWDGMPTKLDMPMQCDLVKAQTINIWILVDRFNSFTYVLRT